MARAQLKAVTTEAKRSREREALAKAIHARDEAQQRVDAVRQAQQTAANNVRTARHELEAAKASVETAKAETARHAVNAALGKAGEAPMTVQAARQAVQVAEDNLVVAESAEAALEKEAKAADGKLTLAIIGFTNAYHAAVAADPCVDKLLLEREALHAKLRAVDLALYAVAKASGPSRFRSWPIDQYEVDFDDQAVDEFAPEMRDALASLRKDADVALPE